MSERSTVKQELSEEEIQKTAESLAKLEPGFLPFDIFHEVARLASTPIVEVVPLRRLEGRTEILLFRRDEDDPVWPNALHTPGTAVRATDTEESAFERIFNEELSGQVEAAPQFVDNIMHHSGRGMEVAQVYWVEAQDTPEGGAFYDIDTLPQELVQTQLDFIPKAIQQYEQSLNLDLQKGS